MKKCNKSLFELMVMVFPGSVSAWECDLLINGEAVTYCFKIFHPTEMVA